MSSLLYFFIIGHTNSNQSESSPQKTAHGTTYTKPNSAQVKGTTEHQFTTPSKNTYATSTLSADATKGLVNGASDVARTKWSGAQHVMSTRYRLSYI